MKTTLFICIITLSFSALYSSSASVTPNQTHLKTDSTKIDLVCRMKVKVAEKAINYTHEKKKYYFCNERCKKSFIENPEKYLKN